MINHTTITNTNVKEEILCQENPNRFCLFPIQYHDIWNAYKKHKNAFWTAEEIDFSADKGAWETLSKDEKYFIENILAFFAGSDGIVLENLVKNFCQEVTIPEARCFYSFQAMMENIHCCSGDTEILTNGGWFPLESLVDQEVQVWNGEEFSKVIVRYTGTNELFRVNFNIGIHLDVTADHKWYLCVENHEMKVNTRQLMRGDRIYPYELPKINEPFQSSSHPLLQKPLDGEAVFVTSVIPLDGIHPTYCFHEPKRNRGVFNGILTGQSEVYSLMIDTFVKDQERKLHLFHAATEIPCVQRKADWAMRWIHGEGELGKRLFAFGIVEGLFFSGSFCAIFWLKERGLMTQSLGKSNEWIARDESLHTEFAILLYQYIQNKVTEKEAEDMIRDAVQIEEEFICESLPVSLIGMNSELMRQYVRFVADRLLVQFGYRKIFEVGNPFPFMEKISLDGKTNFFEQRVTEYSMANSSVTEEKLFALDGLEDDDF